VINLHENEFRIYDLTPPTRCKRFSGAIASGAYERAFVIDAEQHASAVGVHFRPGGTFPFLGISANEFPDKHVDLEGSPPRFWNTDPTEAFIGVSGFLGANASLVSGPGLSRTSARVLILSFAEFRWE
jgi:hypothetical protein